MSVEILPQDYYLTSDVIFLAQNLLGKIIVSEVDGVQTSAKIVETEAYKAPEDRASHAFGNKRTKRTDPVFRRGGIAYIYLCYGIHNLFNIVTGPKDTPHVVLIRAVEPVEGIEVMRSRRVIKQSDIHLTNGPGKWTVAMGIDRAYNSYTLYQESDPVKIINQEAISRDDIISSERIGIAYAGDYAHRPWRFRIRNNRWTSKPDEVKY